MGFRDDHEAAVQRADSLERKLANEKARADELEQELHHERLTRRAPQHHAGDPVQTTWADARNYAVALGIVLVVALIVAGLYTLLA